MKNKSQNIYHKLPILDGLELLDAKDHALNFPSHTHDTFNITLVREQLFSTKLSDRLLHSPAGTITITNPGEVHATFCDNKIGSSFFTFYVSPDVLKKISHHIPIFFENKILNDQSLFQQLYKLSQDFNNRAFLDEKTLLHILDQLVKEYAAEHPDTDKKNMLFQKMLDEENPEKFSLETTARKFGLDKFKFLRLFKQYTGLTPNNYVILKRVEKSKTLLQTEDDLLGIAIETGFYDATHFCKHFKKITGVTPMAYRNAMLCNIVL
ncbi:MAG: helix-turn-helix transcriptional regulator [Bacteroidetes bacterium]|nr:helix-turn-helix transcriptional regulator [Bacteroidota bacterium]